MNTALRISTATLTLLIALVGVVQVLPSERSADAAPAGPTVQEALFAPTPAPALPPLVVINANETQEAMVAYALERFAAAGLELPPVEIEFSDDRELCRGNGGLYWPRSARDPQVADKVDICAKVKTTLLHELAHAWERHFVSNETRDVFLAHWDLDAWFDPADDWHDRGIEMAAETVAYALFIDEPVDADSPFLPYICGYELLTGLDAPAPVAASPCP